MKGILSKIFTHLLVFILTFTLIAHTLNREVKATGVFEKESESYYISSSEDLLEFANLVNSGNTFTGKTVYLKNNIDLEGVNFTPIGYYANSPFSGTFNGQGFVISNLVITSYNQLGTYDSNAYVGLFGYTKDAVITKVSIKDLYVNLIWPSNVYAGGLIGYSENTTINESFVIGKAYDQGTKNLSVGSLYKDVKIGGIVGGGSVTVYDSYVNVNIESLDTCLGEITNAFDINDTTEINGNDLTLDSSEGGFLVLDLSKTPLDNVTITVKDILGLKVIGTGSKSFKLSIVIEDDDIPLLLELDNTILYSIAGTPTIKVSGSRQLYMIIDGKNYIYGTFAQGIIAPNITILEKNQNVDNLFMVSGSHGQYVYTNSTESNKNGTKGNDGFEAIISHNLAIYAQNTKMYFFGGDGTNGREGYWYDIDKVHGSAYDNVNLDGGAGGAGGNGALAIRSTNSIIIDADCLYAYGGAGGNGAGGGRGGLSNRSGHAQSGFGGAGGAGGNGAGAIKVENNIFIKANNVQLSGGNGGFGGDGGEGRASYYSSGVYLDYAGSGGAGGAGGNADILLIAEEAYIDSSIQFNLGSGGAGGAGGNGGNGTDGTGSDSNKRNATDGGAGGAGGYGGNVGGDVSAYYFTNYKKELKVITSSAGNGGAGGYGGNGGDGWSGSGKDSDLKGGNAGNGGRGGSGGAGGSVGLTLTGEYSTAGDGGKSGLCGGTGDRGTYVYQYQGGFLWLETKYEYKHGSSATSPVRLNNASPGTIPTMIGGFDSYYVYSGYFTAGQAFATSSYNGYRVATLKDEIDYNNFLEVLYTAPEGNYLIGATDIRNEGSFVWTDGAKFNKTSQFNSGEPNNSNNNEDILVVTNTLQISDNNLHSYVKGAVFENQPVVLEELTNDYTFDYINQNLYIGGLIAYSDDVEVSNFYSLSTMISLPFYNNHIDEVIAFSNGITSFEGVYTNIDFNEEFDTDNETSYPSFDFTNLWIINGLKNYPYPVLRAFSGNIDDYLMQGYELTEIDGTYQDRNGLIYELNNNTKIATVSGIIEDANNESHEVIILPYVNFNGLSYKVQRIGERAFANKHIVNYTICDEIVVIEKEAFYKAKFTTFNYPANLKIIEDGAFYNTNLTEVDITHRLDQIGERAFANCQNLQRIALETDNIANLAFADCGSLQEVNINTINLGEISTDTQVGVFNNCNNLINLTLGNDLELVGSYAFSNCSSLQTITFGENLKVIGDNAFDTCIELKSIIFKGDCPSSSNVLHAFNNISNSIDKNRYSVSIYYAEDKYFWDGIVAWVDSKGFITKKDLSSEDLYISVINESLPILDNNKILNGQIQFSTNEETYTATVEKILSYEASELTIPGTIVYNGSEYTVTQIGSGNALTNLNENILKIHLPETIKGIEHSSLNNLPNLTHITFGGIIPEILNDNSLQLQSNPILVYYPSKNTELTEIYGSTNICECIELQLKGGQYVDAQYDLVYSKGRFNVYPDGAYAVVGIDVTADNDYLINTSGYVGKNTNGQTGYVKIYDYVSIDGEILEVKEISKYAFYKNEYLKGIEISKTIVEIKDCSFRETSNLEYIVVDSQNSVYFTLDDEENANILFKNHSAGTSILVLYPASRKDSDGIYILPNTVSTIENYAFYNTTKLKEVIFNSSTESRNEALSTIGIEAFNGSGIEKLDLGTTAVLYIGDYAFKNCHNLSEVILPKELKYLGFEIVNGEIKEGANYSPFLDNVSIESFLIEDNDTFFTIDGVLYAINGENIILVQYPALKQGDTYCTSDVIQDVFAINQKAFSNVRFLSEIYIGSGVVQIGIGAFTNCINASIISLPDTLVYLGIESFDGCTKLSEIVVDSQNPKYYSDDSGVLYEKTGKTINNLTFTPDKDSYIYRLIKYPQGITRNSYTMISSVTEIASEAFYGNTSIKRLVLPSNNLTIEDKAFFNCSRLSQVYFTTKTPVSVGNYILYYETINNGVITNNALDNVTIYYNKLYKSYWGDTWEGFKTEEYNILSELPEVSDPSASLLANPYKIVVIDSKGEYLSKASVVFEDKKLTTDEYGQVIFDCTDYLDSLNRIQVTKDGYYKFFNQEYILDDEMRISFITLYSEPEVYGISVLGKDINTETHEINISKDNKTVHDVVSITIGGYCDPAFYFSYVTIYQMLDGEEYDLITYIPTEEERSSSLYYTFDISSDLFILNDSNPHTNLYVKFTTSQFDASLEESWEHRDAHVLIIDVDTDDAFNSFHDVVDTMSLDREEFVLQIDESVPILGGGEISVDFEEVMEILKLDKWGLDILVEEGLIRVGFNCDVQRFEIKCMQDLFDALDYSQGKETDRDYYKQDFEFDVTLGMYLEYKYSESLSNPESIGIRIVGTVEISVEIDFNTTVLFVLPITANLQISAGVEAVVTVGYDFNTESHFFEFAAQFEASVKLSAGIGVSAVSVGLFGNLVLVIDMNIIPDSQLNSIVLTGKAGWYAQIKIGPIKLRYEGVLVEKDWVLYPKEDAVQTFSRMRNMAANNVYNAALYELDDTSGESAVSNMKSVTLGTEEYIFFNGKPEELLSNSTYPIGLSKLMYQIHNLNTNEYSQVLVVDSENYSEGDYEIYSDGTSVHVAYLQLKTNEEIVDTTGSKYYDVKYARINGNEVVKVMDVNSSQDTTPTSDLMPRINVNDGVVYVAWVKNTDNDIFGVSTTYNSQTNETIYNETSANHIYYQTIELSNYSLGTITEVPYSGKTIIDLELYTNRPATLVYYIVDEDCNPATTYDRTLNCHNTLVKNDNFTSRTGTDYTGEAYSGLNVTDNLMTYNLNGEIYSIVYSPTAVENSEKFIVTKIFNEVNIPSGYYDLVKNENGDYYALIYAVASGEGTKFYSSYYDAKTSQFNTPVVINSLNEQQSLESFIAYYNDGLVLKYAYYEIDEDASDESKEEILYNNMEILESVIDTTLNSVNIDFENVDYDLKTALSNAPMNITITNNSSFTIKASELIINVYKKDGSLVDVELSSDLEILSGNTMTFKVIASELDLTLLDEYTIEVYYAIEDTFDNSLPIKSESLDATVHSKQIILDGSTTIVAKVENVGYVPLSGTLYFIDGVHDVNDEAPVTSYSISVPTINHGQYKYYMVDLNEYKSQFASGIVSIMFVSECTLEGVSEINNFDNLTVESLSKEMAGSLSNYNAYNYLVSDNYYVSFPDEYEVVVEVSLPETITFAGIEKFNGENSGSYYTYYTEDVEVDGEIVTKQYVKLLRPLIESSDICVGEDNYLSFLFTDELGNTYTDYFNLHVEYSEYDITFIVYDTIYTKQYKYLDTPIFEGSTDVEATPRASYEFIGWDQMFRTVTSDTIYTALYNEVLFDYALNYVIDGEVYKQSIYHYGDVIVEMPALDKVGYSFVEWNGIPTIMPAKDTTVYAVYQINSYNVNYYINNLLAYTDKFDYNTEITYRENEAKEGYTFSGWDTSVVLMPANDINLYAEFTINTHTLTYMVDGEVYKEYKLQYGTYADMLENLVREGYTFSGWSGVVDEMPDEDVTVTGSFTVNSYTVNYCVDGEIYETKSFDYGQQIDLTLIPTKIGHTFTNWKSEYTTMPALNINVNAEFSVNQYTLTYILDGEEYKSFTVPYNSYAILVNDLVREGYTFSGWTGEVNVMPNRDVTVTGSFTINTYKLNYYVDGNLYKSEEVVYGSELTFTDQPNKTGHTFVRWLCEYTTMPANDLNIHAEYQINSHKLTYIVDGEIYKEFTIPYAAFSNLVTDLTKEGYTFSGWSGAVDEMPDNDVIVTGTFTINQYMIRYYIDGKLYKEIKADFESIVDLSEKPTKAGYTFSGWETESLTVPSRDIKVEGIFNPDTFKINYYVNGDLYQSLDIKCGEIIPAIADPVLEGYTFSSWGEIPEVMPAKNVSINGEFKINEYKLTYIVDGEIYKEEMLEYNSDITLISEPTKEGHTFSGWETNFTKVPSYDIKINGSFNVNKYKLTYKVDGIIYLQFELYYNDKVTQIEAPTKAGYVFSHWDKTVSKMPDSDVELNAVFTIRSYTAYYYINGELYKQKTYDYNEKIIHPDVIVPEYYEFSGWDKDVDIMPSSDIIFNATMVKDNSLKGELTSKNPAYGNMAPIAVYGIVAGVFSLLGLGVALLIKKH